MPINNYFTLFPEDDILIQNIENSEKYKVFLTLLKFSVIINIYACIYLYIFFLVCKGCPVVALKPFRTILPLWLRSLQNKIQEIFKQYFFSKIVKKFFRQIKLSENNWKKVGVELRGRTVVKNKYLLLLLIFLRKIVLSHGFRD